MSFEKSLTCMPCISIIQGPQDWYILSNKQMQKKKVEKMVYIMGLL